MKSIEENICIKVGLTDREVKLMSYLLSKIILMEEENYIIYVKLVIDLDEKKEFKKILEKILGN